MFASNSWSHSKRRAYSSSIHEENELFPSHRQDKVPFHPSRSSLSTVHRLYRTIYFRYFLCVLLGLFIGRIAFAPVHYDSPSLPIPHAKNSVSTASSSNWSNSTLGTAAIIVLNSASRPDRRDYLSLMAAMTDLKLTFLNAWTTKPVPNALPNEHNPGLKDVEYACWRTHADAWRKVVEEGWATAMIIEDDADWDGGIHESMALAWAALKEFTQDPSAATEAKSWDIFYTGTCMDYPAKSFLLIDDPHIPRTSTWWIDYIFTEYFASTATIRRLIQPSIEPVCTHSYIISQTGARKLLYHTNMFLPWGVDVAIIKLINKETITGFSIIPPLFNQWRAGSDKDSDISDRGMPESPMFKNSTRTFVEDVIWGNKERIYIANYEGEEFYDYTYGV